MSAAHLLTAAPEVGVLLAELADAERSIATCSEAFRAMAGGAYPWPRALYALYADAVEPHLQRRDDAVKALTAHALAMFPAVLPVAGGAANDSTPIESTRTK